ncbi:MAG: M20/M25/M40 family metallo-hydrolase [Anaerolineaceae bacterium]
MENNNETLVGLLSHYSPTGSVKNAADFLVQKMEMIGFDKSTTDSIGNVIGIKGNGPNQIVMLGHIDTVPGEIQVYQEGDVLYGRGAVDAKGSLAAFTDAIAAVSIHSDWQVIVIGAMDEEGESNGARFICDQYQPKFVIIGEPSQWNRITLGYKGVQNSILSVQKSKTHSSIGKSSCDILLENWQQLRFQVNQFNDGKSMFDQILASVVKMDGKAEDFEMEAEMVISTRLPESITPKIWVNDWLGKMQDVQVSTSNPGIPAFKADKNSTLARAFLGAIRSGGGLPGFVNKSGTSDMNIVMPKWQCPVVAYGPGDSTLDHTPNEHINIREYWQAVDILKTVLIRLGVGSLLQ